MESTPNKKSTRLSGESLITSNKKTDVIVNSFPKEIFDKLQLAVINLQNVQNDWETAHKRGLNLCKFIESIKSKSFGATGISSNRSRQQQQKQQNLSMCNEKDLYPETMINPCETLKDLQSTLVNLLLKAFNTERCLCGLVKLCEDSSINEIPYRTWNIEYFHRYAKVALTNYHLDYKIKKQVIENIAHSSSRLELIFHISRWQYSLAVDDDQKLLFKYLALETENK